MARSVLVFLAHPALQQSRANRALHNAARDLPGITFHDLYEVYPDLVLDVKREQALLLSHDAYVFQHPFYWYSCPALLKEWFDLVLTHGFAYGRTGRALAGKPWLQTLTTGGSQEDYAPDADNAFTMTNFLKPFEATALLCGAEWQEPCVIYASRIADEDAMAAATSDYVARLRALRDGFAPAGV